MTTATWSWKVCTRRPGLDVTTTTVDTLRLSRYRSGEPKRDWLWKLCRWRADRRDRSDAVQVPRLPRGASVLQEMSSQTPSPSTFSPPREVARSQLRPYHACRNWLQMLPWPFWSPLYQIGSQPPRHKDHGGPHKRDTLHQRGVLFTPSCLSPVSTATGPVNVPGYPRSPRDNVHVQRSQTFPADEPSIQDAYL